MRKPQRTLAALKVLAVDDHPVNRAFLRAVLRPHVRLLRLADSGIAAIDCCASEAFDLIVLDLHMPDLDGFSTWARILEVACDGDSERELHGEAGSEPSAVSRPMAIALSADHRKDAQEKARRVGFRGYVGKPIAPEALLAALRLIVEGESVFETSGTSSRSAPSLLDDTRGLRALGSSERLAALRSAFAEELRADLPTVEHELLQCNAAARERLHQWIGAAGYIGADRLAASARTLQKALGRRQADELGAAYLDFLRGAEATLDALAARRSG